MLTVVLLLVGIIVLFALDILPPDTVVILALMALVMLGILTPLEAFSGFGSNIIVILASIFIISATLQHNGVMDYFGSQLARVETKSYSLFVGIVMLTTGAASAFMNNTSVVALAVLPIMHAAKRLGFAPSQLLMPMAFASLLGGTSTLIGTSTNVVGNNFLLSHGMAGIRMFEFLPIGIVLLVCCVLYFALYGRTALPVHEADDSTVDADTERVYTSTFVVGVGSRLAGVTRAHMCDRSGVQTVSVRDVLGAEHTEMSYALRVNDVVTVRATRDALIYIHTTYEPHATSASHTMATTVLADVLLLPAANVTYESLRENNMFTQRGLAVLGVYRQQQIVGRDVRTLVPKTGDIWLVEGHVESIAALEDDGLCIVISNAPKTEFPHLRKGFAALGIFMAAIILSAVGILPTSIAFLGAVLALISFNILPGNAVYSKVDWRLLVLIGGMTAFGTAIVKTGADVFLASQITHVLGGAPLLVSMAAFMIITVLLTQPMSNAAAALVVLPVAVQTALGFGADPRPFAIAVILAASISMVTPFEPASLLIVGPGRYTVAHFLKIGGLLTALCLAIILGMVYMLYM